MATRRRFLKLAAAASLAAPSIASAQGSGRVVVIGGGFGGLYAARALSGAPVTVTLLDRHNYHLFQPMLYQVATAALSPGDVASPTPPQKSPVGTSTVSTSGISSMRMTL